MAFVSVSQRKITQVGSTASFPSPAHYNIQQHTLVQQCAPFLSTSVRKSLENHHAKDEPGPGDYNISKEILKPNVVSYYSQKQMVFKINSLGSSSFQSESKRFNQRIEVTPGPTQYQTLPNQSISIKKSRVKIPKQKIASSIVQSPSIPSRSKGLISILEKQRVQQEEIQPGPGSYQEKKKQRINSRGTVWGKDKVKRFTQLQKSQIGPGKYTIQAKNQDNNSNESPIFKSNTVRTFFDTLMYGSQNQGVVKIRKTKDYKAPVPAPGQYDSDKSSFKVSKSIPKQYQFFGSSINRFSDKEQKSESQSILTYINDGSEKKKSYHKGRLNFNSMTQRDNSFLSIKNDDECPGPGSYIIETKSKRPNYGLAIQAFGSTAQRLPEKSDISEVGPGQYNIDSNHVLQASRTKLGQLSQLSQQHGIFKSKTQRVCFDHKRNFSQLARQRQYDVSYNDIAKKQQRQQFYIDTLRRINVVKPPFESNTTRFVHYMPQDQIQPIKQVKVKHNPETQLPHIKKKIVQLPKPEVVSTFGKAQRFKDKRKGGGSPGVGSYESPDKWNINTFSQRFKRH